MYLEVSAAGVGDGDAGDHVLQVAHVLVGVVGTGCGQGAGPQCLHHWNTPGRGGGAQPGPAALSHTRGFLGWPQGELWSLNGSLSLIRPAQKTSVTWHLLREI